jgi:Family of unknown function (DUF6812)
MPVLTPLSSRVIDKQPFRVEILTRDWQIEADIHIMINHRPSDVLNDESRFVPLTKASLTPRSGGEAAEINFLALNKDTILYLRELSEGALTSKR